MNDPRIRREPPPFRPVEVAHAQQLSPDMHRVTLCSPELHGFDIGLPAGSVRLLLPSTDDELELPTWRGNEFLLADDLRPTIRTVTPVWFDAHKLELGVEVVIHGKGPLSDWASSTTAGDRLAVSGTGRGYDIDASATSFLIAGDESAIPAIRTILPALPEQAQVRVIIETRAAKNVHNLPAHPNCELTWREQGPRPPGDSLLDIIRTAKLDTETHYWVAGEAAAVQRIRKYLFAEREVERAHAVVRGYWKLNRSSGPTRPLS